MPAATLLTRKHLAWHTCLDLPLYLTLPSAGAPGVIHAPRARPADDGPGPPGAVPGWLAVIGITNPGWTAVRGADFTAPLAFKFPGRQVIAARVDPGPAARTARFPAVRLHAEASPGPGDHGTGGVQLVRDFLLRPGDGCTITLILTGTPATGSPPVRHDGALAAGKITSEQDVGCGWQ